MSKKQKLFIDLSGVTASCHAELCLGCNSELSRNMNSSEDQPAMCEECLEEDTQKWFEQIALRTSSDDVRMAEMDFGREIAFTEEILLSRSGRHAYMHEDIADDYF